jgi:hypothetical protein
VGYGCSGFNSLAWMGNDVKINPFEVLLEKNLDLKAENGSSIPYKGFIQMRFKPFNSQIGFSASFGSI